MTKINKEGWEVKKLGEVCENFDSKRKPVTKSNRVAGPYPYYGATGQQDSVDEYIFDGRYVLLGEDGAKWGAHEASAYIIEGKCWVNNHAHILKPKENLIDSFLTYYLNYADLDGYITGAIVRKLTKATMNEIQIPLPPLPIQRCIVEELDEINAIISAKKQQISKLDELAQSIFYNMFGDPVNNEKGWEVKTFKQCFSLKSGDGLSAKNFIDGQYPVYGGNGITGYHNTFNKEGKNIIIGRVGALCGNVHLVEGQIFVTDNAFVLSTDEDFEATTLLYLLRFLNLRQFARDALQPVISNTSLKDIKIILPPLPLQETFAARVSAIEEEKAAITASIDEMQTLLNARMQEYFG